MPPPIPELNGNESLERIAPSMREARRQPGDGRRRLSGTTVQVIDGAEVVGQSTIKTLVGGGLTLDMLEIWYHSIIGSEGLALLSVSTSKLDVAEDMIDLLDTISATLELGAA